MNKLDEIKNSFIDSAVKHGEATETGDYKTANFYYKIIVDSYKKIRISENGMQALHELMYHKNHSVQLWSATYNLQYYPEDAKKILQLIKKNKGLVAFSAEITLEEWEKGKLKFPE